MTPYLHFKGNAEDAMNFYRAVLGGQFLVLQRYGELPGSEKMPASDREKLVHAALQISPVMTLMASDTPSSADFDLLPGTNIHLCIHTDSENETDRIFEALCKKGSGEMPLNKTFWVSYFGMSRDQFGVQWMVNYAQSV